MTEFTEIMDQSRFDALLGEMLGSIAELEGDGHNVMHVADAAVIAALRKVHQTQRPSVAHAWASRIRDMLEERIALCDELAEETVSRVARARLN